MIWSESSAKPWKRNATTLPKQGLSQEEKFWVSNPMSSENSLSKVDVQVGNFRMKTSKTFAQIIGFLSTNR